jgi:hypothetical protein
MVDKEELLSFSLGPGVPFSRPPGPDRSRRGVGNEPREKMQKCRKNWERVMALWKADVYSFFMICRGAGGLLLCDLPLLQFLQTQDSHFEIFRA